LTAGDVCEIRSGEGLIHSLFHLDRPSVTLVARTYYDPDGGPQYSFLRPGIALDRFYRDERLPRLLQLFAAGFEADVPNKRELAVDFLRTADLHACVLVLERLASFAGDDFEALIDVLGERDRAAADMLRQAFVEMRRQQLIVEWRRHARAPEHRFLLALLLNVEGREAILRLVQERVGTADAPIDQIVRWLGEMSPPRSSGGGVDNPLSYEFGEVELRVVHDLLMGLSADEIMVRLENEFDDVASQADDLRALCAAVRQAPMLRPLFR
jgi:hypothetical protein